MTLVTVGINHESASLALRERLAVTVDCQSSWLNELLVQPAVTEAMVLSTCNRTEIYCRTLAAEGLVPWLARQSNLSEQQLTPHVYCYQQADVVHHAIRVASGLDSMMVGEPQIFGQMKQAVQYAETAGGLGPTLRQVFRHVFSAAKRIRTETEISKNPTSIAFAAVKLLSLALPDLAQQKVMLIGAGNTTHLVAKYLAGAGVSDFYMANRTLETAAQFAKTYQGKPLGITEIAQYLATVDIVVSATACPLPFITAPMVAAIMPQRQHRPLYFVDLAVPRDIEAAVADLAHVFLYNIDDLQRVVAANLNERQGAAQRAEALIAAEVTDYIRWQTAARANSTIERYRNSMENLRAAETVKALKQIQQGACPAAVITELSHRLMNKITHQPSLKIRKACLSEQDDLLRSINTLYETE